VPISGKPETRAHLVPISGKPETRAHLVPISGKPEIGGRAPQDDGCQ